MKIQIGSSSADISVITNGQSHPQREFLIKSLYMF